MYLLCCCMCAGLVQKVTQTGRLPYWETKRTARDRQQHQERLKFMKDTAAQQDRDDDAGTEEDYDADDEQDYVTGPAPQQEQQQPGHQDDAGPPAVTGGTRKRPRAITATPAVEEDVLIVTESDSTSTASSETSSSSDEEKGDVQGTCPLNSSLVSDHACPENVVAVRVSFACCVCCALKMRFLFASPVTVVFPVIVRQ